MRIAYLDLPDDMAAAAGELWPDSTWVELIEYAIGLLIADTRQADTQAAEKVADLPHLSATTGEEIRADLPTIVDTSDTDATLRWLATP